MLSRLNARLLNHGTDSYNKLAHGYKKRLFSGLSGRVLEIGPGTGANLPYYHDSAEFILLEPSPFMQTYLRKNAAKAGKNIDIHTGKAEDIPFDNDSFDAVVSTLVLCSVSDLEQGLTEIKRVLKPRGTFYFIEHVAAPDSTWLRRLQNGISPIWRCLLDGCHPNRETARAIKKAGFRDVHFEHTRFKLPIVSPHIIGTAVKG